MAWPGSISQSFLVGSFNEAPLDNILVSETDHGTKKVRKRFTGTMTTMKGTMLLTTEAQYDDLMTFYNSNAAGDADQGAAYFQFDDQHGITTRWWRFLSPPKVTNVAQYWKVAFEFEEQPSP